MKKLIMALALISCAAIAQKVDKDWQAMVSQLPENAKNSLRELFEQNKDAANMDEMLSDAIDDIQSNAQDEGREPDAEDQSGIDALEALKGKLTKSNIKEYIKALKK